MSKLSKKRKTQQSGSKRSKIPWKRSKQQKRTLPVSQLTNEEISAYKREMGKVVDYANFQVESAWNNHEVSLELHRFLDGDESKRFDISNIENIGELRAYMTNLQVVLSTIEPASKKGAIDSALIEAEVFRGQFGNQHRQVYTDEEGVARARHYNVMPVFDEEGNLIRRAVDPQTASKAFAAYRRLEEQYAGYIGRQGQELMFGSENLIILLYDFYDKNPGADYDNSSDDALAEISPLLSRWIDEQMLEMEGINYSLSQASAIIADWDDFFNKRYF